MIIDMALVNKKECAIPNVNLTLEPVGTTTTVTIYFALYIKYYTAKNRFQLKLVKNHTG